MLVIRSNTIAGTMPNGTVNWDKAVRLDRATEKVVGITAKLVNSHWLTCFPPGHQGIPAILLGFFTLFILPNQPESTRFFTEREREIASERGSSLGALKADTGAVVNKGGSLLFWLETGFSDLGP